MATVTLCAADTHMKVRADLVMGSELVKFLITSNGDNFHITIPDKYYTITQYGVEVSNAMHNYVSFVSGTPLIIYDRQTLVSCFDVESYFEHRIYFEYLVKQLFDKWSYFAQVLYQSLNIGTQREIYLLCPYDIIPDVYIKDEQFFNLWFSNNRDKVITLNQNEHYVNETKVGDSIDTPNTYTTTFRHYTDHHNHSNHSDHNSDDSSIACSSIACSSNSRPIGMKTVGADGKEIVNYGFYYSLPLTCINGNTMKIGCGIGWQNGGTYGSEVYYDPNGKMVFSSSCHDGRYHGYVKIYYLTNPERLHSQYLYVMGNMQGIRKTWYDSIDCTTGKQLLSTQTEYLDGKRHGFDITYYESGRMKSQLINSHEFKHGPYTLWYDNDDHDGKQLIMEQGNYTDNMKHGLYTQWHNQVDNKEIDERKEEKEGKSGGQPVKQSEGLYVRGKEHGQWQRWYKSGRLNEQVTYRDGKIHGPKLKYYNTEGSQLESQTMYINECKHGEYIMYHPNGDIKEEGQYDNNERVGSWTTYHQGKVKADEGEYNLYKIGLWTHYFKTGRLESQGHMDRGMRQGLWTHYYDNPQNTIKTHIEYIDGVSADE